MGPLEEMAKEAFDALMEHYPTYCAALQLQDSVTTRMKFYADAIEASNETQYLHPIIAMFVEEMFDKAIKEELAKLVTRRYHFKSN